MKVDYDGNSSFFYNETSYQKDSLSVLAFDKQGEISDEDAYGKLARLPGSATNELSVIDFKNGLFLQQYKEPAFFEGKMPMALPQWTFTGDTASVSEYKCKSAVGDYLGRKWTVWFTEAIPVNTGPWLLWGTPGLIVYASDSEKLITFSLVGVERISKSRRSEDLAYRRKRLNGTYKIVFSLDMEEMEKTHSRYRRDTEFMNTIHGITGGYTIDRNGSRSEIPITNPYIPLISDDYWD